MDLEYIIEEWKKDSEVDETNIKNELLKTPQLHAKYLTHLITAKAKLAQAQKKYNKMGWIKRKYFRGEFDQEDLKKYGWSQWNGLKPSSSELNQLIEMDSDMNDLQEQIEYYKTAVQALEYIMKQIHARDYSIKTIFDYMKYVSG